MGTPPILKDMLFCLHRVIRKSTQGVTSEVTKLYRNFFYFLHTQTITCTTDCLLLTLLSDFESYFESMSKTHVLPRLLSL
uniref:Uncharacterized protein n=1 Tax=Arundo donax TaxID=35708 RepID=A0A0A9EA96_ARUDO